MNRNHPRISAMEREISTYGHWLPNDEGEHELYMA